jgi:kynurenine formamidase
MQMVDLSVTLEDDRAWAPWWSRTRVKRRGHKFGRLAVLLLFGLLPKYLRNGLGWADETISLSTHGTTHLDAPWHYAPTCEGRPAKTIDQVPLPWCYADGVVLDMRHKKDGETIGVQDVEAALAALRYTLKPMDIVLIQTGNDRMLGTPDYFARGTGVSAAATRWILDRGVKITGIDSWGWDLPLCTLSRHAKQTGRNDLFWEAHFVGVDKEYCHLERLTNLDQLPPFGFKVCCFPLKVKGGSAGPCRVVAMIPDGNAP